jgi:hypothetical protein
VSILIVIWLILGLISVVVPHLFHHHTVTP